MDDGRPDAATLKPVLEAFRQAAVLVRAYDRRHLIALDGLDLAGTVRELFESAVCMGEQALAAVGVEEEEVARVAAEYRRRDALRLIEQSRAGDLHAGKETMFSPDNALGDPEAAQGLPAR